MLVAAAAIGTLAASYGGCVVYDSSLLTGDGALAPGDDNGGPCANGGWPAPPDGGDTGGGSVIVAAFDSIDIGYRPDGGVPPFGYNLDKTCTCPGPPSCTQAMGSKEVCDDDAGRDNTAIQLFDYLGTVTSVGTTQIDQGLQMGQYGLLMVISGYNNLANDPKVKVDFYVSNGVKRDADGGIPSPRFDGTDVWTLDPGSLIGGQPKYTDDSAYVSNNQVVAKLGSVPIAFGDRSFLGGAQMVLQDAIIVGTLQTQPAGDSGLFGYQLLGGTIAGRWSTKAILGTLASIPTDPDGSFLCPDDSVWYAFIKASVCATADISQTGSNDNIGLSCDAVSVGMQFTAKPAQLGPVYGVEPAPAGCMKNGQPFFDSCSSN
jgi:hypothetical protein